MIFIKVILLITFIVGALARVLTIKHYQNISNDETTLLLYGQLNDEEQICQPIKLSGWMWHYSPAFMTEVDDKQEWFTECKVERKDITIMAHTNDNDLLHELNAKHNGLLRNFNVKHNDSQGYAIDRIEGIPLPSQGKRGKFTFQNNTMTARALEPCWVHNVVDLSSDNPSTHIFTIQ